MDDKPQVERLDYWKKRALNALKTAFGWAEKDLKRVQDYVAHVGLEDKDIKNALKKITDGFAELSTAIAKAEVKEAGKKTA